MCFRFDSCFGVDVHDDVDFYTPPPSSTTKAVAVAPPPRHAATTTASKAPAMRDGYYHYSNGHQALHRGNNTNNAQSTAAYHHQSVHVVDEASRRKRPSASPAPAVPAIGSHGYATGAWAAGGDEASKHPAARNTNNRGVVRGAGNGAPRGYYYEHGEQPAARKDVTKDYYYYHPTATVTSDLERY